MSSRNSTLTRERAASLLSYEAETGRLTWARSNGRAKKGKDAGSVHSDGYRCVCVDGVLYQAHRVAWFLHYGAWPVWQLDHINAVKTDNRISNLRDVCQSDNLHNICKASARSTTGVRGVSWSARLQRFEAQMQHLGKKRYLGIFKTVEEASAAYGRAKAGISPAWLALCPDDKTP